ncbi:MAG: tRNA (N6-isopentenyl adenosine(37)-C2)-methylthiotransferase MiaB [Verrucomicrobia bacterium]|nr:tRNA (N6-isopentenyl adenosine(37)-C2)-methylthiotransferase MiaB [Verrucomicrobiota bacterium]
MKVYLKTYGCQMNERDSEQVARDLLGRGYELTGNAELADVVLLNTCSVRDQAEQKALGKMGTVGAKNRRRPEVVYGFLGCMAQARGESLLREVPHLDLVVGTQKFHRVADHVDAAVAAKRSRLLEPARVDDLRFSVVDVGEEEGSQNTIREHTLKAGQATAFVSIMQGCNMHCTYCIVPRTRGEERGRPIAEIVAEVRSLVERGVKEVTLLGQIVNLYGRHEFPKDAAGKSPFVQLLEAVAAVDGLERLRFTSPHPIGFRADLIDAFARIPELCEHVHFPMQSGSDRILKAMHRGYTIEKYLDLLARLRAARPGIAFTTDVIVGFPGETEEDFAATLAAVRAADFHNAFVFRYSPRAETPAAELADQHSDETKEARNQALLDVVNELARRHNAALVGQRVQILCEGPSKTNPNRLSGRTRTNKIVVFEGRDRHIGRLFDVAIDHSSGFTLYGRADVAEA